jgi:hypothetical protein
MKDSVEGTVQQSAVLTIDSIVMGDENELGGISRCQASRRGVASAHAVGGSTICRIASIPSRHGYKIGNE